jgi:hypothetical protein
MEMGLLGRSTASIVVIYGRCAACTTQITRVGHEVILNILQLDQRHVVALSHGAMGFGLSVKLEVRQPSDEANALKVVRKRLLRLRKNSNCWV